MCGLFLGWAIFEDVKAVQEDAVPECISQKAERYLRINTWYNIDGDHSVLSQMIDVYNDKVAEGVGDYLVCYKSRQIARFY